MPQITHVGRVMVPVADQDTAIAFYTEKLGFSLDGGRSVRRGRPLGRGRAARRRRRDRARAAAGRLPARRMTGIALDSTDPKADHAELTAAGVDVDAELMGGDGVVPLLFFFRDHDGNHLMIVETQAG